MRPFVEAFVIGRAGTAPIPLVPAILLALFAWVRWRTV